MGNLQIRPKHSNSKHYHDWERLSSCQLHYRLSEYMSLVNTYISAHSLKTWSLFFFMCFLTWSQHHSFLFLTLDFSSKSHFFWHRQLCFLLSGFLLIYTSLAHNFLLLTVFLSGPHICPHQHFFNSSDHTPSLVTTASCLVPTTLRELSLLYFQTLKSPDLSVLHSPCCSCRS